MANKNKNLSLKKEVSKINNPQNIERDIDDEKPSTNQEGKPTTLQGRSKPENITKDSLNNTTHNQ